MHSFPGYIHHLSERLRPKLYLWVALVVAVPRLLFFAVAPGRNVYGNAPGELAVAKNMAEGGVYLDASGQPDSDFNPGYPSFLALWHLLSGNSLVGIKLSHVAFDIGTALALSWVLAATCSTLTVLLFAIALALHPLLLLLCNNINDEPMLTFLIAVSFVALYRALQNPSIWRFVQAGVLLGLAIFTKSTALFLPFFLTAALWLVLRKPTAPRLLHWVAYLLASIVILLPWAYRNYVVLGHFAFNVHGIGQNLWFGSDPYIFMNHGTTMRAHAAELAANMRARGIAPPAGNNVFDREQWQLRMAIQKYKDLLHEPLVFAQVLLLKAARTLYASEDRPSGHLPLILLQIPTVILAVLGTVRLWKQPETRTLAWLLIIYVGYYYAIVFVGLPMVRYFVPAIPFLLAAAAEGLSACLPTAQPAAHSKPFVE